MSLTTIAWLVTLVTLFVLALRRPVYGFSLYLLTFFMFPQFWWWGRGLPQLRWNLYAGLVLAVATVCHRVISSDRPAAIPAFVRALLILLAANATIIHFILAPDRALSEDTYVLLLKFILLLVVVTMCIRDRADLRIAMWSMALGAAYIGYEVTINDRGSLSGGRLEGIGAAGVANANQLASLMATILPLTGALFLTGSRQEKIAAFIVAPFILNVLLLCNSRGAFLATIAAGVVFVFCARGPAVKKAKQGLALGGLAVFLLLGDPDILNRFTTVFVSEEERDSSAESRLVFWSAALEMIADHPLGAGGDGFQAYAGGYLSGPVRPIHNGYLTEAADWGIQGLALRLLLLVGVILIAARTLKTCKLLGDGDAVILGACLLTAMTAYLGTAVFGDYIDEEWGYWMMALIVVYARLYTRDMPSPIPALDPSGLTPQRQVTLGDVQATPLPSGAPAMRRQGLPS
jgi:putative inorganic carbon (HCO3(-)) transporter